MVYICVYVVSVGVYIHSEILFSHRNERNPAICDNIDEPRGHYAKWNKSDREIQILYDLTSLWNLKVSNS